MAELPAQVIWQNYLFVDERASDLAELCPVCGQFASDLPVIWQNCLYVDSVPVIWQNCVCVEEHLGACCQ
jgi:hypothetical protein